MALKISEKWFSRMYISDATWHIQEHCALRMRMSRLSILYQIRNNKLLFRMQISRIHTWHSVKSEQILNCLGCTLYVRSQLIKYCFGCHVAERCVFAHIRERMAFWIDPRSSTSRIDTCYSVLVCPRVFCQIRECFASRIDTRNTKTL